MPSGKHKPKEFPAYASMQQMSADLNIPMPVLKRAKHKGCKFQTNSICWPEIFIKWYFSQGMEETPVDNEDWHTRGKRAEALKKEEELREMLKESIDYSTADEFIGHLVKMLFNNLDRLANEFPPSLKGKTEAQIKDEVIRQRIRIDRELKARLLAWKESAPKEDKEDE